MHGIGVVIAPIILEKLIRRKLSRALLDLAPANFAMSVGPRKKNGNATEIRF